MLHTEQHFNYTFNWLPFWLLNNWDAVINCAIKHASAYQSPIGTRDDLYKTLLGLKNSILILYSKKKTKMAPKFIKKAFATNVNNNECHENVSIRLVYVM